MEPREPLESDEELLIAPEAEPAFDDLASLAAQVCGASSGIIALKNAKPLWLKAGTSLPKGAGDLVLALCGHVLESNQLTVVADLEKESVRGVTLRGAPPIRFFAGVPLLAPYGRAAGVLAVADAVPLVLDPSQEEGLAAVARQILAQLELRRILTELARAIGDRHRFEQALRDSEERYRELIENANDVVYTHDLTGHFTSLNRAGEKLSGYTRDEVLQMDFSKVVAPEFLELARHMMARKVAGDPPRIYELEMMAREGRRIALEVSSRLILKDGKPLGVQGIARDITERRTSQASLQQANEQLTAWIEQLEQRNRESGLLSEMGDLLQICLTAREAYNVVARTGRELFRQYRGALMIIDAPRNVVETAAAWGERLQGEPAFAPEDCWALRRGRAHFVGFEKEGPFCQHLGSGFQGTTLCVPMMAQGEPLGVVHLQGLEIGAAAALAPAVESAQRLAQTLAEHVGLALANLRLRETLRNQSIRDALTGLFNRRYLEASMVREVQRAARKQRPLSVIMLDVDHFKKFNDTHGHQAGDALLRELGDLLQKITRGDDIACRYGGEEFTLILPEAKLEDARQRAEQLRAAARDLAAKRGEAIAAPITVSCGVAAFPEHGATAEDLLRTADRALYQAKNAGRDRVVVAAAAAKSGTA